MNRPEQPNLKENLSALVDGETSDWELKRLLAELDSEAKNSEEKSGLLQEEWHLNHIVSASLNKSAIKGIDLSSRISTAIENESAPSQKHFFFKPFSQVAVAASVAVFALLGIQQLPLYTSVDNAPTEPSVVAEQATDFQPLVIPEGFELPPLQTQTVSSSVPIEVNRVSEQVDIQNFDEAELDEHLQDVISTHFESTSENLNSVIPLVRQIRVEEE